jgi:pseudouridine synthase
MVSPLGAGRSTIALGDARKWVSPIGRLDKDTTRLLLLANDTEFADFVTNPESHVPKTYLVKTNGLMSDEMIARLNAGVGMRVAGRCAKACAASKIEASTPSPKWLSRKEPRNVADD